MIFAQSKFYSTGLLCISIELIWNFRFGRAENEFNPTPVSVYCSKPCTTDVSADPCGDGLAQHSACTYTTLTDPSLFGYNISSVPSGFTGCSLSACEAACASMNSTSIVDVLGDTICFPSDADDDFVFTSEDIANMMAISKGCSGSHMMMGDNFMIGDDHTECDSSYSISGVIFTGVDEDHDDHDEHDDLNEHDDLDEHDDHEHDHDNESAAFTFTMLTSIIVSVIAAVVL